MRFHGISGTPDRLFQAVSLAHEGPNAPGRNRTCLLSAFFLTRGTTGVPTVRARAVTFGGNSSTSRARRRHAPRLGLGLLVPALESTTPRVHDAGLRWSRRWFEDAADGVVVGQEVRRNGGWEAL